jgi:Ca2+-binding RTX toxin-like protein
MLGLLGIFGAVAAGLFADTILQSHAANDASDDADMATDDPAGNDDLALSDHRYTGTEAPSAASLATHLAPDQGDGTDNGMPRSDDTPKPLDPDRTLHGTDGADNLAGGGGNDRINGGGADDALTGGPGNDRLRGGTGKDALDGGDGNDTLAGGAGDDWMTAGQGNDALWSGTGNDWAAGQDGNDTLAGGAGNDSLIGGDGDDIARGGSGDDWLSGCAGNDALFGGRGADTVDGGSGNDTIWGQMPDPESEDADYLNGGDGDDTLHIGATDTATGGAGADSFLLHDHSSDTAPAVIADYTFGEDRIAILYDPARHPTPQITIEPADDDDGRLIVLDGTPLALVTGGAGLTVDALLLQPTDQISG